MKDFQEGLRAGRGFIILLFFNREPQSCYQVLGLAAVSVSLLPPIVTCGGELWYVTKEQPAGTKSPVAAGGVADTPAGITACNPSEAPILQASDLTGWRSPSAHCHPVEGGESQTHSAWHSLFFFPPFNDFVSQP